MPQMPHSSDLGASSVQLELANRNTHAVGADVAQAEDAPAGRDTDDAHVRGRPVAQDLSDPTLIVNRNVHAPGAPKYMAELQARFCNGRVVEDRHEPHGI